MTDLLNTSILGNSLQTWGIALAIGLGFAVVLAVAVRWMARRFASLAERTSTTVDDLIANLLGDTKSFFYLAIGTYVGAQWLVLSPSVGSMVGQLVVILVLLQGGLWANAAVRSLLESYRKRQVEDDPAAATTIGALSFVGRLAVWAVVLVLALDNLGVDITALVTGLGIGGIAVALAVQNVLGDLFAAFAIYIDRPCSTSRS